MALWGSNGGGAVSGTGDTWGREVGAEAVFQLVQTFFTV